MQFRLREGFRLFASHDAAIDFECRGEKSGVRPIAQGGDRISLSLKEVQAHASAGTLGKLEPVDAEATEVYGNTKPIVSRLVSNPESYVPLTETKIETIAFRNS